jgi:hypothetical protein
MIKSFEPEASQSKEGLVMTARNESIARISHHDFFDRYLFLAGISGTLGEVRREIKRGFHCVSREKLKALDAATERARARQGKGPLTRAGIACTPERRVSGFQS